MSEELKVDCGECKDLGFARNLAAQMKEGYGRHNSNLSFRDRRGSFIAEYCHAINPSLIAHAPVFFVRESNEARVIGRFGERPLRSRMEFCQIGDACPVREGDADALVVKYIPPVPAIFNEAHTSMTKLTTWTFEKVRTRLTNDNGLTWQDEYFWKRIE